MNRYHLVHITEFHYDGPVSESYNEVRLRPMTDEKQSCLSFKLTTNPASVAKSYQDAFGNWVHQFNVLKEHRHLKIETDSVVLRLDVPEIHAATTLEQSDAAQEELHEEFYDYLVGSKYVPHLAALDKLIADAERNSDGTAFGFADAASHLIHEQFKYVKGATHVRSSIEDALTAKAGVCQDFAHLLLGASRKRGLPARYVSGYLVPDRADNPNSALEEVIGGQASHAWVEVYIPECGWMALDPTLGMAVGPRHVRIAYGRDYGDVAPVRGLYNGHAGQRLSVDVQLRPDVDIDGHEQLNRTAAIPTEETIVEERPGQPMQQAQQ
jgi:transglutaminase-like putative cysteine protease